MKKRFTLLSVMMIATSLSFAQTVSKTSVPVLKMKTGNLATSVIAPESNLINPKAPGDVIWSTNLSSSDNWTFTSLPTDAQSANHGWRLTSTETTPLVTTKINSASAGQYAVVWNGNPNTPATVKDAQYIMTLDTAFDLSAYGAVNFDFQQSGALFTDKQVVEASVDNGVTWVEIGNNDDMGMLTANGGSAYPNPTNRSYNIKKAFPAAAVYTAVKFRFRMHWEGVSGANKGVCYGWYVDDIKLVEGQDNDLKMEQAFAIVGDVQNELTYTKMPAAQATADATVNFSAIISNEGSVAQNTTLNVTGAGGFDETSSVVILPAFGADSIALGSPYAIVATVGNQNFTLTAESDLTLTNTSDDSKTIRFEVTENVMAVDGYNGTTGSITSSFIGWQGGTSSAEIGNYFEIFEDASVGAIQVGIANITGSARDEFIGRSIQAKIYDASGTEPQLIDASLETTISNTSFGKLIRAYMITPSPLEAGKIYLVTAALSDGAAVPIAMGGQVISGNVVGFDGASTVGLAPDVAGGNLVTCPIVRLDFTDYTSVDEIAAQFDLNVYPNPFTSNAVVAFELKNDANVSINVTDITGRTVATVDSQMYTSGAHTVSVNGTDLNAGIYNCTITIGNNVITKTIVKK